jgi:hypothetical protein
MGSVHAQRVLPSTPGEDGRDMPVWTVQTTSGDDERVEAGLLATEGGALVALSEEGLMVRAWAPGQWCTVWHVGGAGAATSIRDDVLVGFTPD